MKSKTYLFLIALTLQGSMNLSYADSDALNSAVVNAILAEYNSPLSALEIEKLPRSLKCGDQKLFLNAKTLKTDGPKILTNADQDGLLLDLTDGDQVHGFFVLRADLDLLMSKKSARVPAKSYDGFWWSDGDHYSLSDSYCKLL